MAQFNKIVELDGSEAQLITDALINYGERKSSYIRNEILMLVDKIASAEYE